MLKFRMAFRYSILAVLTCMTSGQLSIGGGGSFGIDKKSKYGECFVKKGSNHRLSPSTYTAAKEVSDLTECRSICDNMGQRECSSFSYRGNGNQNCLLSPQGMATLSTTNRKQFVYDDDSTFYVRAEGQDCQAEKENLLERNFNRLGLTDFGGENCYHPYKNGMKLAQQSVKNSLEGVTRQQCEDVCTRNSACTAINFSQSSVKYDVNCEISTIDLRGSTSDDQYLFEPSASMQVYRKDSNCGRGFSDRQNYDNFGNQFNRYGAGNRFGDLGNRGNRFGDLGNRGNRFSDLGNRGNRFSDLGNRGNRFGDIGNRYGNRYGNNYGNNLYSNNMYGDSDCFRMAKKYSRLSTGVVREKISVRNLRACKDSCQTSRTFHCMALSYSYRNIESSASSWFGGSSGNCYLSDRSAATMHSFDVNPDREFDLYVKDQYDRRCGAYGGKSFCNGYVI